MALLEVRNVKKSFGGLIAVNGMDIEVEEGKICGLIGPNGAGKTTLFNIASGFYRPDAGEIYFAGERVTDLGSHERCIRGLARTFQIPKMFPEMSVVDERGRLLPDLVDILDLVKAKDAIFATSHLGPREIEAIVHGYASQMKILINHPLFLPRMPNAWFAALVTKGAYLEICATSCQPMAVNQGSQMTLTRAADLVRLAGVERCVISSDAGQTHNPWPADALRAFINCFYDIGMPEDNLRAMAVTNPAKLLSP